MRELFQNICQIVKMRVWDIPVQQEANIAMFESVN